jgi:diguanylate cyclase (GGDEF)-like protein
MLDRSNRMAALDNIVTEVKSRGVPDSTTAAGKAVALLREKNDMESVAAALWIAGTFHLHRYEHVEAQPALDEAIAKAAEAGDSLVLGRALEAAAEIAFRLHDYSTTLAHGRRALAVWQEQQDMTREAVALTWVGSALMQMSCYQEAFEKLYAALELFQQVGKQHLSGRALNYIAIMHEELGDFEQAFRFYDRSLEMVRLQGDPEMEGRVLANVGEAYVTLKHNERALNYLDQASNILRPLGAHALYGWCRLAMARLQMNLGDNTRALEIFKEALEAAEKGGAKRTLAEALTGYGVLCARMGDYQEAQKHMYRALQLADEAQVNRERYRINEALAEVHEQFGDYQRALKHYQEFHRVRADVFDELAKAKITSLTSQFEWEKALQAQEISHLRNVELARAYEELKGLHVRLEEQARELQELSIRDDLTSAFNRRYLDQRLADEFVRSRRYNSPLTIAMWDVDGFKEINDRMSHAVGDTVLRRLVEIVGERIRQSDILVRYGGEEFVVVFLETTLPEAIVAAEKIRAAVQEYDWSQLHPDLHEVTVSLGVASDVALKNWGELLVTADANLYRAKVSGKNRVCY